jgi:toxin ParE1/3/4
MHPITLSPAAYSDAAEIWAYVAENNEAAANRLLVKFEDTFKSLAKYPRLGKAVDIVYPGLRFLPEGNYLIFYRLREERLEIVRILHGARDITAELFRLCSD